MKFRTLALMAFQFAMFDKNAQMAIQSGKTMNQALIGTSFQNVPVGNNPIFIPSKTMQINRKRRMKRNARC